MPDVEGKNYRILIGDVIERLRDLPAESIHMVVTSPPYWNLRRYHTAEWEGGDPDCKHHHAKVCTRCGAVKVKDKQIGLEKTPTLYVKKIVQVFREVHRVLRSDGTVFLNLGDTYNSRGGHSKLEGDGRTNRQDRQDHKGSSVKGLKPKDLIGIPWMVAFALRADGWWLRQDIIWAKRVPMPESAKDRCTRSHEFIFHLAKSEKYFYDHVAVKEPISDATVVRGPVAFGGDKYKEVKPERGDPNFRNGSEQMGRVYDYTESSRTGRNRRDVWLLSTAPSRLGHFAQFTPHIPLTCIQAGTSDRGCCPVCQAPWQRISKKEKTEELDEDGVAVEVESKTITWAPSCKCHVDFEAMKCSRCQAPLKVKTDDSLAQEAYEAWKKSCGADADGKYDGKSVKDFASGGAQDASDVKRRILEGMNPAASLEWELACECGLPARVPAVVMDVFHGSGTTGAVANYLGRHYIGIELSAQYAELYDARSAEVVRSIIGRQGSDRKSDVDEGQMGLF